MRKFLQQRNNRGVPRLVHIFLKSYLNARGMNLTRKRHGDVYRIIREDYPDLDLTRRKIQEYCLDYARKLDEARIRPRFGRHHRWRYQELEIKDMPGLRLRSVNVKRCARKGSIHTVIKKRL